MAPAFAILDQPENEKQLLVADARRQKLPGAAAASRWSLETLRAKLDRSRRPGPFDKKAFRKSPAEASAEPVVTPAPAVEANAEPVVTAAPAVEAPATSAAPAEKGGKQGGKRRIQRGDMLQAKVMEKRPYGVIVQLPLKRGFHSSHHFTALVHVSELSGGGPAARSRRLNEIAVGEEFPVEVVRTGESLRQIRTSERAISHRRLLTELAPGTTVKVVVTEILAWGVVATIQDSIAKGFDGVIHVSKFPGRGGQAPRKGTAGRTSERDQALRRTKLGQVFDAEVLSVEKSDKRSDDLSIRLTLRGPEERAAVARFSADTQHTGKVVAHEGGVFVVRMGNVKGYLPEDKLGSAAVSSLKVGENVHVRVESFDEARLTCQLSRRGL